MKKIILFAFVLTLGIGVSAQSFGLRAGYTMSGLTIDDAFSSYLETNGVVGKLTNGMNIGLLFEMPVMDMLAISAELAYAQYGSANDMTANVDNNGTSGHGQSNLNYFELPIMAKVKFGPAYIAVGPYVGYLLNAQEITYRENATLVAYYTPLLGSEAAAEAAVAAALGVSSLKNDEYYDLDMANFERLDFGAQLALGAQFPVGPVTLFGEAKGAMAFTNWEANPTFLGAGFEYKKNFALTFSIGVMFDASGK